MAHDHAHNAPPSETAMRVKALETLLTEKGLLDPAAIDALVETYETKIGPRNGAKVVARAWTDPDYKQRLLEDGSAAIAELGFSGVQGEDMIVVENSDDVHNLVTCTLCSCLSVADTRAAAHLVQERPLPGSLGHRPARGARGIRRRALRRYRDTGVGQQCRTPLPGAAAAACRDGKPERGRAGGIGDPRFHDRHGAG